MFCSSIGSGSLCIVQKYTQFTQSRTTRLRPGNWLLEFAGIKPQENAVFRYGMNVSETDISTILNTANSDWNSLNIVWLYSLFSQNDRSMKKPIARIERRLIRCMSVKNSWFRLCHISDDDFSIKCSRHSAQDLTFIAPFYIPVFVSNHLPAVHPLRSKW